MNGFNLSDIQFVNLGSSSVTALYYGNTQIWPKDYSALPLTITSLSDNNTISITSTLGSNVSVYVFDTVGNPNATPIYTNTINANSTYTIGSLNTGQLYEIVINSSNTTKSSSAYLTINATGDFKASGNVMSLLGYPFDNLSLSGYDFYKLFNGNTHLKDISNLILPATTLATYCYAYMFSGCTGIISVPSGFLPSNTLATYCYYYMFNGCTGLTSVPYDLLSANILTDSCYRRMFYGCSSLINPPKLLATTLAAYCYSYMFHSCSSLTLEGIYNYTLPAEYVPISGYDNMFVGTSLVNPPIINAKTINTYGCRAMFYGCASLIRSPRLHITQASSDAFNFMFTNCSSLQYIYIDFENPNSGGYNGFTSGVAASGTFVQSINADWPVDSVKGIPLGWTRKMIVNNETTDYVNKNTPLTIEGLGNSTIIKITNTGTAFTYPIEYSKDGFATFYTLTIPKDNYINIIVDNASDIIQIRSSQLVNGLLRIDATSRDLNNHNVGFKAYGNILSLGYGSSDTYKTKTTLTNNNEYKDLFNGSSLVDASGLLMITPNKDYAYANLFKDCTMLTKAPALPTPTAQFSHSKMFQGCTSLVNPPIIPGDTIAYSACEYLFDGCTSLVDASDIMPNITTLNAECLRVMFGNCSSLRFAPKLPVLDTIPQGSMNQMFINCTSLTTAPDLICTTIATWGCYRMFYGCTSLNYVKCTATAVTGSSNTSSWLNNVSSTGTFVKDANSTIWSSGSSGIPSGWTVQNAT